MNRHYLLLLFLTLTGACGDSQNTNGEADSKADHAWQEQTQTIDKAKEVNQIIQDSAERERQAIDEADQ
jgi:hypothetical protein